MKLAQTSTVNLGSFVVRIFLSKVASTDKYLFEHTLGIQFSMNSPLEKKKKHCHLANHM